VSQDDDVTSVSTDTGTTDLVAVSVRTIAALWWMTIHHGGVKVTATDADWMQMTCNSWRLVIVVCVSTSSQPAMRMACLLMLQTDGHA